MGRESEYLLSLLGDFLWERKPEKREDTDWQSLVQLAQIHNVTGILGYMTKRWGICPDGELAAMLRSSCMQTVALCTQRVELAKQRLQSLTDAGIPHIAMKGLLVRECYPVPELRTFGDVDLVIRPQDRQKCHQLFLSMGFQVKNDWEPVYSYLKGAEFYEIHTRIMEVDVSEKADYQSYFDRAWEFAVPEAGCRYAFTPEFHFLYLLTHIAKHAKGAGAGARMYLDIAAYLQRFGETLDWNWIQKELEKLALWDFARTVLSAAESWFGAVCPMPFERISGEVLERFCVFTMEAGLFGQFGRESGEGALRKAEGSRAATLLRRLFPKAKTIETRYTYLQGRPYLLPVAWIHRLVITRGKLKGHAQEARTILTADEEKILRLRNICREIGL